MDGDRTVSRRQFSAAGFAALLSPLLRLLPGAAVRQAGRGAAFSVLLSVPALVLLAAVMGSLRRRMRPGESMAGLMLRAYGPVLGRIVLFLYAAWLLFYAGYVLRSGAERLAAAVYRQSGPDPFLFVMAALCLIVSLGPMRAAFRTAVILRTVLLTALVLAAAFSVSNIDLKNVLPPSWDDWPGIVRGAAPAASAGGVAALLSFLNGYTRPPDRPGVWLLPGMGLYCVTAAGLCFAVTGTFGAALTAELRYPFFTMMRDVNVFTLAQRVEAVAVALWVLADFVLCVLLWRCAHEAVRTALRLPEPDGLPASDLRGGRWLYFVEAAVICAAGKCVAPTGEALRVWGEVYVPAIMDAFTFGGFAALWLAVRFNTFS